MGCLHVAVLGALANACASEGEVVGSVEAIRGRSPPDVELTAGGAFAAPAGLSLAVLDRRGVPRVLGYGARDLSPRGGPEGCF